MTGLAGKIGAAAGATIALVAAYAMGPETYQSVSEQVLEVGKFYVIAPLACAGLGRAIGTAIDIAIESRRSEPVQTSDLEAKTRTYHTD